MNNKLTALLVILLIPLLAITLWGQQIHAVLSIAQTWTALQTFSSDISLPSTSKYSLMTRPILVLGQGTANALTTGDDNGVRNALYNDTGVTWHLTAIKCFTDVGSSTTTINPTFGSTGTGTTILSGALTCGSSFTPSSSGTISNANVATSNGIAIGMGGTLTGTQLTIIFEYTF